MPTYDSNMTGPTIEDVEKVICPDDKPYKCVSYGNCYGYDHYCSRDTRRPESCFPAHLVDEKSISSWCQTVNGNISRMLDPSCRFACNSRLTEAAASPACEYCSDYAWKCVIIAIIAVVVALLGCFLVYKLYKRYELRKSQERSQGQPNQEPDCPKQDVNVASERTLACEGRHQDGGMGNTNHVGLQPVIASPPTGDSSYIEMQNPESRPLLAGVDLNISMRSGDSDHEQTSPIAGHLPGDTESGSSTTTSGDDSGISPGRYSSLDQAHHVQQLANGNALRDAGQGGSSHQTNCQTHELRRPDQSFYVNASIPDVGDHKLVTSLSTYVND